jgi:hypothetical protein
LRWLSRAARAGHLSQDEFDIQTIVPSELQMPLAEPGSLMATPYVTEIRIGTDLGGIERHGKLLMRGPRRPPPPVRSTASWLKRWP